MDYPDEISVPRGSPISYTLRLTNADTALYTVSAKLKKIDDTSYVAPPPSQPEVASFAVNYSPAIGGVAAYWTLSISGAQCSSIGMGRFITDEKFELNGIVTSISKVPLIINITESVSG